MQTKTLYFLASLFIASAPVYAMQPPALSQFRFGGASVLLYTTWPTKPEAYFLLGREAGGRDAGTYDAFGGRRDAGEGHPVVTAARELAEETIDLLGDKGRMMNAINVDGSQTSNIVANYAKNFVVYVTSFHHSSLEYLARKFYDARSGARRFKNREKDKLAWVKWSNLAQAIANAQRDQNGHLLPVTVWAKVVQSDGSKRTEKITIRPVFVSCMQSYFNNGAYTQGKNHKIRFYQR